MPLDGLSGQDTIKSKSPSPSASHGIGQAHSPTPRSTTSPGWLYGSLVKTSVWPSAADAEIRRTALISAEAGNFMSYVSCRLYLLQLPAHKLKQGHSRFIVGQAKVGIDCAMRFSFRGNNS